MSEKTEFNCDLCTNAIEPGFSAGRGGKGLSMNGDGRWTIDDLKGAPRHLCNRCLSSVADLKVCIAGVIGCGGGMKCGSDHK